MHRRRPAAAGQGSLLTVWALALACSSLTAPSAADGAIVELLSPQDNAVLAHFGAWRQAVLDAAGSEGDSVAKRALAEALAGTPLPFDSARGSTQDGATGHTFELTGAWRCRFFKLGPGAALTVHGWFACRIEEDDAGTLLAKTTGSQRINGRLYRWTHEQLLFLGALYYDNEEPLRFGDRRARDQLALLTRLADDRMLLEFPAPAAGSDFAILEFRR